MKRTPEQCKTFFIRQTDKRGLGRELYQTPYSIIEQIVDSIIENKPELMNKTWIDPCAGDGRWEEIIRKHNIKCRSYDIEPLNDNVIKQDFYTAKFDDDNLFFIGNPPFSLLKDFINISLTFADSCYYLGGSQIITGTLSSKVDLLHRFEGCEGNQKDKRSKIQFIDTNNNTVNVWACGAIFDNASHKPFKRSEEYNNDSFRVSIKNYCQNDNRVIVIRQKG